MGGNVVGGRPTRSKGRYPGSLGGAGGQEEAIRGEVGRGRYGARAAAAGLLEMRNAVVRGFVGAAAKRGGLRCLDGWMGAGLLRSK